MLIIDDDYPMAHGAIDLKRDLMMPIEALRAAERKTKQAQRWLALCLLEDRD